MSRALERRGHHVVRHGLPRRLAPWIPLRRFRRSHLRAGEAAFAERANAVDVRLGWGVDQAVTLDFDSSQVEVYGRRKPGAAVNYHGQLAYQPLLAGWAQRGRMLATELLSGSDPTAASSHGSCSHVH